MAAFCAEHTRGERESGEADAAEASAGNGGDLPETVSPAVFLRQVREAHVGFAQWLQPRHRLHARQQRIHWWLDCTVLTGHFLCSFSSVSLCVSLSVCLSLSVSLSLSDSLCCCCCCWRSWICSVLAGFFLLDRLLKLLQQTSSLKDYYPSLWFNNSFLTVKTHLLILVSFQYFNPSQVSVGKKEIVSVHARPCILPSSASVSFTGWGSLNYGQIFSSYIYKWIQSHALTWMKCSIHPCIWYCSSCQETFRVQTLSDVFHTVFGRMWHRPIIFAMQKVLKLADSGFILFLLLLLLTQSKTEWGPEYWCRIDT